MWPTSGSAYLDGNRINSTQYTAFFFMLSTEAMGRSLFEKNVISMETKNVGISCIYLA